MKKFLAIALLVVLVASVLVVASTAAETPTYWAISSDCLIKSKVLDDGTVPTFKAVDDSTGVAGLLVGIPTAATYGDDLFQAKDGYTIGYYDYEGRKINQDSDHIGTTDRLVVFKDGVTVAEYGLVTYGDADGDGVFDVIDAAIAALCHTGKMDATSNPAVYEAVKPRKGVDNPTVEVYDYQYIVNDALKNEKDIVENLKGRKTPVDDTLNFESVIYENTGAARPAEVTANDSNFMECFTIKYKGTSIEPENENETETKIPPKKPGIYLVSAIISDSENYLVTPGERELGFIVIAPKSGTGYKITADNANKKIIVGTTDNDTSNKTLADQFEEWLNIAYTLTVGGTQNPSTVASALPNRSFEVYSGQKTTLTKTPKTDVLGSYLPDDETLWTNNTASNSKAVSISKGDKKFNFDLVFQQDEETINTAKKKFMTGAAASARGQRTDTSRDVYVYVKQNGDLPSIRLGVKTWSATCFSALNATGAKSVLVGVTDAVAIQASSSTDFTGKAVESLYESNGYRYSQYSGTNLTKCLPAVKSVLKGMGVSYPSMDFMFALMSLSDFKDKTGYCNYRCSGENSSIRYNTVYFLEFRSYSNTEDAHYTLTVGSNVDMVEPSKNYTLMTGNEPIDATAPAGYKLVLKDANGNEIPMSKNGYYLMPYSNATIEGVPV